MNDIKKPEFMKDAIQARSHNVFLEIIIALVLLFVGYIVCAILQVPAMTVYLMNQTQFTQMVLSNTIDYDAILDMVMDLPEWLTVVSLLSEIGLIVVFVLYCRFFEKRKAATLGFCKKGFVPKYLIGAAIGAVGFAVTYLLCYLTGSVGIKVSQDISVSYLFAFLIGYMVQGMAEEVLCRGYMLVTLTRRYSVSSSVIVSAAFFALLHGANEGVTALAYINLFLFGVFLSLLFIRYENIWIVAGCHSLWNFFQGNIFGVQISGLEVQPSVFSSSLSDSMTLVNGGSFGMEGGAAVTLVLACAIAFLYRKMKKDGYIIKAEPVQNPYDRAAAERRREAMQGQPSYGQGQDRMNQPQNPNMQNWQGKQEQAESFHAQTTQDAQQQPQKENQPQGYENMGVNPEETPWRPQNPNEQSGVMTDFDQSYFKD